MAEQIVTLAPGEGQVIAFEAIPSEAKVYQVLVDGLTGSFRAVAPPTPAGILIWHSQIGGLPGYSGEGYATVWDIKIFNPSTRAYVAGTPTGIKDLDVPMNFPDISAQYYIIWGLAQTFPGPANWSPYHLVAISQPGEYAWTADGLLGADEDRNLEGMEAVITAQVGSVDYYDEEYDHISLTPLSVVSGDFAFGLIPSFYALDNLPPGIKPGNVIQCSVRYDGPSSSRQFRISDITMVPAYPPDAYQFDGNLFLTDHIQGTSEYDPGSWLVTATISGNVTPFAVHIQVRNRYGYWPNALKQDFQGPGTCSFRVDDGLLVQMYAHPDPAAIFNDETWRLRNWVRVINQSI